MPSKSKRNRRITPQNRRVANSPTGSTGATMAPAAVAQPEKAATSYTGTSRATSAVPMPSNFVSELKWIGLVTLIVVIILIVAYYVVPR